MANRYPTARSVLRHCAKLASSSAYRRQRRIDRQLGRLRSLPRFQAGSTGILGRPFHFSDGASFALSYRELFLGEPYYFETERTRPLIIDCGANVGLSIAYFKRLFPNCHIDAFEADPGLFELLKRNVESQGFGDVRLHQQAVWSRNETLEFHSRGDLMGHVLPGSGGATSIQVDAVALAGYLDRRVDFLKIDVEGVETEILESCERQLANVDRLFVEYHSPSHGQQTLQRILGLLSEAGFRYYLKEIDLQKRPFVDSGELRARRIFDLQVEIFATRPNDSASGSSSATRSIG